MHLSTLSLLDHFLFWFLSLRLRNAICFWYFKRFFLGFIDLVRMPNWFQLLSSKLWKTNLFCFLFFLGVFKCNYLSIARLQNNCPQMFSKLFLHLYWYKYCGWRTLYFTGLSLCNHCHSKVEIWFNFHKHKQYSASYIGLTQHSTL